MSAAPAAFEPIKALTFPAHVNFDITYRCNASCSFCYVIDRETPRHGLDVGKAEAIITRLADNGVFRINFFGGEPTIEKHLPHLIRFAKSSGMTTSLISNGLALTDAFVAAAESNLDAIAISIHGRNSDHDKILGVPGAYDKVLRNLQRLAGLDISVGINFTVLEGCRGVLTTVLSDISEVVPCRFVAANRFIGDRGKQDDLLEPGLDTLNDVLDEFDQLKAIYPKTAFNYAIYFPFCMTRKADHIHYLKGCGLGSNYWTVDFDGNAKLCSYANGTIGNVLTADPASIWNDSPLLKEYRRGDWVPGECRKCSAFDTCHSGCRVSDGSKDYGPDSLIVKHPELLRAI
jgi:radical SAM protein with 4Fe4S-binding SPASM domain